MITRVIGVRGQKSQMPLMPRIGKENPIDHRLTKLKHPCFQISVPNFGFTQKETETNKKKKDKRKPPKIEQKKKNREKEKTTKDIKHPSKRMQCKIQITSVRNSKWNSSSFISESG
jgi:hypothetical protein